MNRQIWNVELFFIVWIVCNYFYHFDPEMELIQNIQAKVADVFGQGEL